MVEVVVEAEVEEVEEEPSWAVVEPAEAATFGVGGMGGYS